MFLVKLISNITIGLSMLVSYFFVVPQLDIAGTLICGFVFTLLTVFFISALNDKFDKELSKIKNDHMKRGATDVLDQMYDDLEIHEIMKQSVPLRNSKGEEYGSTSVWGKLRDFRDRKYEPSKYYLD